MTFEEWAEKNKIPKFIKRHKESKAAWDAAINEAINAIDVKNSDFPSSLVRQVVILLKNIKEIKP